MGLFRFEIWRPAMMQIVETNISEALSMYIERPRLNYAHIQENILYIQIKYFNLNVSVNE